MTARSDAGSPRPVTSPEVPPAPRQPLTLSGLAFAGLLLVAWFLSGGDAPDYTAADDAWTTWAGANRVRSGVGGFVILLAGLALLHFAGTIRGALATTQENVARSTHLARVAVAGAVVGGTGIAMAIVMVGATTSEGSQADPLVSRAVMTAATGPYLVAAMGFAALLGSAGLLTVRHGPLPRWTGVVALVGALAFVIPFLTLIAGTGKDSAFGYGFLPGILALATWSSATSIASYRRSTSPRQASALMLGTEP